MMRSNSVTKVAKPPPPIPPRPNKTLVAEALAKTRINSSKIVQDNTVPTIRSPPVPPLVNKENFGFLPVTKSNSTVHVPNNKTPQIQRSTSNAEQRNENSRTVIFQSSNLKTSKTKVKLMRNGSGCEVKNFVSKSNQVLINLENDRNTECNRINRSNSFKSNNVHNEKNHVNELIDEMFASILDIPECDDENTELPEAYNENVNIPKHNIESSAEDNKVSNSPNIQLSNESLKDYESSESNETDFDNKTRERRIKFDDKKNHELLISELQNMRKEEDQKRISKRQRRPSLEINIDQIDDLSKIHQSDWVEVNNGQEVRLSRLNMSSYGLPPLPKSLSGFSLNPQTPSRITPPNSGFSPSGHIVYSSHTRMSNGATSESPGRSPTTLDNQLAILRREMYSLRQLDLSLLSQLWSLNESIQDFRQMLQDQDDRGLSPPSPSPSPSSCDDGETDEFFSPSPMKLRPAPPPPPLRRTSNSSSATSSEYGTV